MSDHETTLRELANRLRWKFDAKPEAAACLAGADALRREDALRGIIESGIVRYKQNGGCSNCGGTPHTATCLVGQLELWLHAPTEPTR